MSLPFATPDLPGLSGTLKQNPSDFRVREVPLYPTSGEGEFLYLTLEKTRVSAEQLVQHLARSLDVPRGDIGVAGLKDRWAVTEQTVSVPAKCEPNLPRLPTDSIRLLAVARHRNKLRTGHLAGNAFEILLRTDSPDALSRAEAIAYRLRRTGFPNYYGDQRFGHDQETLALGFDLLTGVKTPRDIHPARRRFLLRLALSAAQSELFNRVLAERIRGETWRTVLSGDVMQVVASGGLFLAEDVPGEQARLEAGETAITGPMFGPKMRAPTGEVAALEQAVALAALSSADGSSGESGRLDERLATKSPSSWFGPFAKLASGTRRALMVHVPDLTLRPAEGGLLFQFTLPAGCYATTLLREFQKPDESDQQPAQASGAEGLGESNLGAEDVESQEHGDPDD
jgi:tRNA pseudouridine13 synthase